MLRTGAAQPSCTNRSTALLIFFLICSIHTAKRLNTVVETEHALELRPVIPVFISPRGAELTF